MMPNRHSLFWSLALVLVAFFLLSVWLSWTWGRSAELKGYYLSAEARSALADYARRAERAWLDDGREGIDRWLAEPRQRALDWVVVLDGRLQSLGSRPLTTEEAERLTFLRGVDWPMSSRSLSRPFISLRFPEHPEQGRVVLRLPAEFVPPGLSPAKRLVTHGLVPAGLALLLGVLLYRRWIVPLGRLRAQANALRGNDLTARTQAEISRRSDELGDLGRAFDHMAERLDEHMVLQRQLLRDLSHELRTPLARLQVAAEGTLSAQLLRERLEQEVQGMQQLVDNTLELAWMDTERPVLALEDISIPALWDLLVENARFESGWAAERFRSALPEDCVVRGNLNALAQALENLLRNAIRHSPEGGVIRLHGRREGSCWWLCLEDQGEGVAEHQLETIFRPFTRLSSARTGKGFGLGLSIARRAVVLQGGRLWAEAADPGLRLCLVLPSA